MSNIPKRISDAIFQAGLTQHELAEKIGTTDVSINRYVTGKRVPKITTMEDIANACGVDMSYFFDSRCRIHKHIEMIDDYIIVGNDYQYYDNKGVLIRCCDCKKLHTSDCPFGMTYGFDPELNDFCSKAVRKE